MKVVEHSGAASFLSETLRYRTDDPWQTNVLGSIAEGVEGGRRYDREDWFTVRDRDQVIGAAVRTAPFPMVVGPMPAPAAHALGRHLRQARQPVPALTGPEPVVMAIADEVGHPTRLRMRESLRVLGELVAPQAAPGAARRATPRDADLVLAWLADFRAEAGLPVILPDAAALEGILTRMWLWCLDGEPVAMAAHGRIVGTPAGAIARIGPVYTRVPARRQGIAASLTALLAVTLQGQGAGVMLSADTQNQTSNGVYARLGFRVVGETVALDLL